MKEQIKELARAICGLNTSDGCFCDGGYCNYNCLSYEKAEALYNAGYRKQSGWISVKDRLPTQRFVIACDVYGNVDEVVQIGEGRFEWISNDDRAFVTHWMPLPKPPKMKGGE